MKFSKNMMNDGARRIKNFIKENKVLPNWVKMVDMDNKKEYKLKKKEYAGLYEGQYVYWIKHGRQPNYTTFRSTANNPLVLDYQSYSATCCPTSLSMASQLLYNYKTENECANALGTDKKGSGTSPYQLITNSKKLGFNIVAIGRNIKSVQTSLNQCRPVIMHIQTKNASCLDYRGDFGHYILCYGVKDGKYMIADPTKGIKTCKPNIIDKATNGRDIKYYSVGII